MAKPTWDKRDDEDAGTETDSDDSSTEKRPDYVYSNEQLVRVLTLTACCVVAGVVAIVGATYWGYASNTPLDEYIATAEALLAVALGLSICMLCLALGFYRSIMNDVSHAKLLREEADENRALAALGAQGRLPDTRTTRDKVFATTCIAAPVLLVIITAVLAGTVPSTLYPTISSLTPCDQQALPSSLASARVCPYWRDKAPEKQLYLQDCAEYNSVSCCTRAEAASIMETTDAWLENLDGDRYGGEQCKAMLRRLSCWVCSPDQELFFVDGKLRVCERMCNTLLDICADTVFDHSESTFSDLFSSGTALCNHFQYTVDVCSCFEAYPNVCFPPHPTHPPIPLFENTTTTHTPHSKITPRTQAPPVKGRVER